MRAKPLLRHPQHPDRELGDPDGRAVQLGGTPVEDEVGHQLVQPPDLLLDPPDHLALLRFPLGPFPLRHRAEVVHREPDEVERVADLVGHPRGELPEVRQVLVLPDGLLERPVLPKPDDHLVEGTGETSHLVVPLDRKFLRKVPGGHGLGGMRKPNHGGDVVGGDDDREDEPAGEDEDGAEEAQVEVPLDRLGEVVDLQSHVDVTEGLPHHLDRHNEVPGLDLLPRIIPERRIDDQFFGRQLDLHRPADRLGVRAVDDTHIFPDDRHFADPRLLQRFHVMVQAVLLGDPQRRQLVDADADRVGEFEEAVLEVPLQRVPPENVRDVYRPEGAGEEDQHDHRELELQPAIAQREQAVNFMTPPLDCLPVAFSHRTPGPSRRRPGGSSPLRPATPERLPKRSGPRAFPARGRTAPRTSPCPPPPPWPP